MKRSRNIFNLSFDANMQGEREKISNKLLHFLSVSNFFAYLRLIVLLLTLNVRLLAILNVSLVQMHVTNRRNVLRVHWREETAQYRVSGEHYRGFVTMAISPTARTIGLNISTRTRRSIIRHGRR